MNRCAGAVKRPFGWHTPSTGSAGALADRRRRAPAAARHSSGPGLNGATCRSGDDRRGASWHYFDFSTFSPAAFQPWIPADMNLTLV